jgi:signal transduction histidine kinase/ActR/RegA family two-component response regulator
MKLRSHLLLLSLATLLPMAIFAVGGAFLLAARERQAFERGAIERVRALMTAVDVDLSGSISTLEALAVLPAFASDDLEAVRPQAARVLATQPGWINIVVTRPSGEHLMNLLVPAGKPLPPSQDRATAARAAQTGRSVVGDMVRGAVLADRLIFTIRTPVFRDGQVKYVLAAVIDPAALMRLLERQEFPQRWVAAVLDARYRFVARTQAPPGASDEATATLRQALASGAQEGWIEGQTLEGTESFRAFARSAHSGWSVSVALPKSEVYRSSRQAALLLGLGALLAMAAGIVLALLFARRIVSPMASLVAAAPMLGQGDASAAPPDSKVDEVRGLTAALHEAGRAIREREARQKEAEAALRATDRAKDEFLAMLGHELRNPLATLSTAAELLKLGHERPEIIATAQALIGRQTRHMAHLVDDLLEVGRVTGGKIRLERAPVDLGEIAARVADTWRSAGRLSRHALEESLEPAWILADAARVEQIISNLVDNAVKYTPEGGRISLRVRRAGAEAILEVADEGQGLAPELIGRVFDLFVQGERGLARQQGGLGIGLTLVKRLAELHKGSVKAASGGPGKGATFTVAFPAIQPPAVRGHTARAFETRAAGAKSEPRATGAKSEPRAAGAKRVLIVEDNGDARETLAQLLGMIGHEVSTAKDGAEGLRLAATAHADVALVDIGLPDLSGYEVAKRLRSSPETAHLHLVALTGYGRDEDRKLAIEAGFDEHLTKPVELEELERLLESVPPLEARKRAGGS